MKTSSNEPVVTAAVAALKNHVLRIKSKIVHRGEEGKESFREAVRIRFKMMAERNL